jgi:phosphorylase kinase alpha/beta subunit
MRFHNPEIERLVPRAAYRPDDLRRIEGALVDHGALHFAPLPSGLFAASSGAAGAQSGYANAWLRDNVHVAFALYAAGETTLAAGVARALLAYADRHRHRFTRVIGREVNPDDVLQRPHVRFNAATLDEIPAERWPHAQNDALGYVLWLCAGLARAGVLNLDHAAWSTLTLFPRYFEAIRYWEDRDSGHWEETRRISASSIGTVVAGLEAVCAAATAGGPHAPPSGLTADLVDRAAALARRGREALAAILPHECAELAPDRNRRYDAALLFLLCPLGVVTDRAMADLIVHDIDRYLTGKIGVRRYLWDSYWAPDYADRLATEDLTRDYSDDVAARDALIDRPGDEAQWCLFDPLLSAQAGWRYRHTGAAEDRERQALHLTRALAHVTPSWQCPELYYLRRGTWVPNPHTPLLWTQGNLLVALHAMRETLGMSSGEAALSARMRTAWL